MDLQLYYSPRSCAFAPHILLYDADANFDVIKVNFDKKEQNSTDYLKVNPKGRVPALLTSKGTVSYTHLTLPTTPYV